jgi:DNA-binding transcriptional ArsR family regulator
MESLRRHLSIALQPHILKRVVNQTTDLDRTFHALADKSRRAMVERLTLGPASVSELAEPLTISLAAVVQHVQVLESCGLVRTEKIGRTRTCRIERAAISAAEQWITDRRRSWEVRLDRLGDLLDQEATKQVLTNEIATNEEKA